MTLFEFDNEIKMTNNVSLISGSDEVGRGAMAGPIVVASVILNHDFEDKRIRDSKIVPKKIREILFELIKANSISYSIKVYDSDYVDKVNPKQTSKNGMLETISDLKVKPEIALLDAEKLDINGIQTVSLIKGDSKSQSIAAASILAKVYRDRIMDAYDTQYPGYSFSNHKGYCTKAHYIAVDNLGVLDIHRKSYKPIIEAINKK
ncbi:ribonuclease HII [Spiroplasma sp. TIUS-1]|uniref:ribonuclease HII n=1 Tax=Spiroplasma sp. TIUS-1 TaxID=216963 RepID=UPI001398543A|nr:ribonuclease HII [Spiroplasma sp. TIUS-1]QHX35835.1 ribonuclease HII [Spiroplasma sp. TIUS-1]